MNIKDLKLLMINKETLFSLSFILLINFFLLKNALMTIALALVFIICVFGYFDKKKFHKEFKYNILIFLFFTSYYIFNVISIVWSNDQKVGFSSLQHSLILLVLPISIIFFKKNISQNIYLYLLSFVLGLSVFCLGFYNDIIVGYSLAVTDYLYLKDAGFIEQLSFILNNDLGSINDTAYWGLYYSNFNPFFFRHHAYFSAILLIGSIASVWLLFKIKHKSKFFLILPLIMFLYTILEHRSLINKTLLFLIPLCLLGFKLLVRLNKYKINKNLIIFMGVMLAFLCFSCKDIIWNNFLLFVDDERKVIYTCFEEIFINVNYIFGVGIGDGQSLLDECINLHKTDFFLVLEKYNTHSTFLHFLLSGGVFNLILYVFLFLFLFYKSIKMDNSLLFVVILVIIGNNLFENFSNRVLGAYTTSIFLLLCFFYKYDIDKNKIIE